MKRWLFFLVAAVVFSQVAASAQNGGYNVTSDLWAKAVLQAPSGPVILDWKEVGSDITPSGDQVVSGYFYADPTEFAYGSEFNPEVFVKIYITADGWCNIAFNHVTVDAVDIYSAHNYNGVIDQVGKISTTGRLDEHQYVGVTAGSDPVVDSNEARTESLRGNWAFQYTIGGGAFTHTYALDGTVEKSNTPGSYVIAGTDEYGTSVLAGYSETLGGYMLYSPGILFDRVYVFDFESSDTVDGCYYQAHSTSDMGSCYWMTGFRYAHTATMQKTDVSAEEAEIAEYDSEQRSDNAPDEVIDVYTQLKNIAESYKTIR